MKGRGWGRAALGILILLVASFPGAAFSSPEPGLPERAVALLEENCLRCHGRGQTRSDLDLRSRAAALKGGKRGPALVPGKPAESRLILSVAHREEPHMPPRKPLAPEAVTVLERWVAEDARWPEGAENRSVPVEAKDASGGYWWKRPIERPLIERPLIERAPIERVTVPPLPPGADPSWARNPIDAFILEKLAPRGLAPAEPAGKAELLRRAHFDLLGLPPSPEEVDAFLADTAADAFERHLDRLLDSPHYGERWGRHWLDLVRYAESNGYERDGAKPQAWRYRDYVIRSFNEDKPFDRFIREQLAGDELDDRSPETLVATGFYRLGSLDDEPDDKAMARFDELDDIVRTTGAAFLGLTVNCARCHDHKFDAIPQVDYYRLLSFFSGLKYSDEVPLVPEEEVKRYQAITMEMDGKVKALEAEVTALVEPTRKRLFEENLARLPAEVREAHALPPEKRTEAQKGLAEEAGKKAAPSAEELEKALGAETRERRGELKKRIQEVNRSRPPRYPVAMGVVEEGPSAPPMHLRVRGNAHQKGPEVEPRFLSLLTSTAPVLPPRPETARSSGRRRALADWLADPGNPLTARVLANRLWQFHFGRGIVRSSSDFGKMGDLPTHPELLDWLAAELVEGGYRLKRLHRLIMTSRAYQLSSRRSPRAEAVDPENDLLSHFSLRRLEAEAIRDSVLQVSGRLNPRMGGPSVFPPIPREVLHGQSRPGDGWGSSTPEEARRRSIYVFAKKSLPLPVLEAFDMADTGQTCARRNTTTIAPQALTMLNGPFLTEQAEAFAERLLREVPEDRRARVERAYRLALSRPARAEELAAGLEFLALQEDRLRALRTAGSPEADGVERKALTSFCLVLFNLNEFVYVD